MSAWVFRRGSGMVLDRRARKLEGRSCPHLRRVEVDACCSTVMFASEMVLARAPSLFIVVDVSPAKDECKELSNWSIFLARRCRGVVVPSKDCLGCGDCCCCPSTVRDSGAVLSWSTVWVCCGNIVLPFNRLLLDAQSLTLLVMSTVGYERKRGLS